jgi:hypothetical protein
MMRRGAGSDPFEHYDAAYLLGALSSEERAAFETHLSRCAACTARVVELRPVTAALASAGDAVQDALSPSREQHAERESAWTPPASQTDRVTGLIRRIQLRRRRTRWAVGALATVAVATIAALAIALATPANPAGEVAAQPMTATGPADVRATAAITAAPWGSEITIDCSYTGSAEYTSDDVYALEVVDQAGQAQQIGSWTLSQNTQATFTSGTALRPSEIRALRVTEPDGTVVLRLSL